MSRAEYQDAYQLVGVIRNAGNALLWGGCGLGGVEALYGLLTAFGTFGTGTFVSNAMMGCVLIAMGVMTALAGFGSATVIRGVASILLATTDTAVATRSTVKQLEAQSLIAKTLLAQVSVIAAKTK